MINVQWWWSVTSFVESMSNLLTTKYYIQETSGLISVSSSSKLHFTSSHSPLVGSHCGHIWKKCNEYLQLILSLYWFFFNLFFSTCCDDTTLCLSELSCNLQFCVHAGMMLWMKFVSKSVCATRSAMYYKVE